MKVTIEDVAEHAGVSTATVSRYLNNSPYISQKSRERVEQSISTLNYRPSFFAQSLAGIKTKTIALIIDTTNESTYGNEFFVKLQFGIERSLCRQGFYLLVVSISDPEEGILNLQKMILEKRIEGIISPIELASEKMIDMFQSMEFPFILIGQHADPAILCADMDNLQGGVIATESLINLGSSNIAFLSPEYKEGSALYSRLEGYKKGLISNNKQFTDDLVFHNCNSPEDIISVGEKLMLQRSLVDGVICTDSNQAFLLVEFFKKRGVRVPQDVQIIGFDNTQISQIMDPCLSVVNIDVLELGQILAQKLISFILKGESDVYTELIGVDLIFRDSTK